MKLTIKELYQILRNETQDKKTKENIKIAETKLFEYIENCIKDIKTCNEIFFLVIDLCMEYADNAFEDGFRIAAALFKDSFESIGLLN